MMYRACCSPSLLMVSDQHVVAPPSAIDTISEIFAGDAEFLESRAEMAMKTSKSGSFSPDLSPSHARRGDRDLRSGSARRKPS